jgi:hypothetical protein
MEPAARCPAPRPLSGAGSAPLPTPVKGKTSTGEQAANSDRQVIYAEVDAAYAGVVDGRPVTGANAGVDSSTPLPTKDGASDEGKEGSDVKTSHRTPHETKCLRGEDVTVGTIAGGHLVTHRAASKMSSGPLKLTANGSVSLPVQVASMEVTLRRICPGAPREVSGLLSGTPTGTTTPSAQVEKVIPPGERRNKTPVYVSGVKNVRKFLDWIRAKCRKLAIQMNDEYLMLVL